MNREETEMEIKKVTDEAFGKYGRVITDIDFKELVEKMQETPLPKEVIYEPSAAELEKLPVAAELSAKAYGEMPIQIGYCNGDNVMLNALEYHRSSEINVTATDAVLMVGMQQDITKDFTYDTAKVEAFLVPAGCAVELFATTLHYAPCTVKEGGFRVSVILPKGTNYELKEKHAESGEDAHLTAVNKWLLGHPEGGLPKGSPMGLIGKNLNLNE